MAFILLVVYQMCLDDYKMGFMGYQKYFAQIRVPVRNATDNTTSLVAKWVINDNITAGSSDIYDFADMTPIPQINDEKWRAESFQRAKDNFIQDWSYTIVILSSTVFLAFLQKIQFNIFQAVS